MNNDTDSNYINVSGYLYHISWIWSHARILGSRVLRNAWRKKTDVVCRSRDLTMREILNRMDHGILFCCQKVLHEVGRYFRAVNRAT